MKPYVYSALGETTAPKFAAAFAQGCGGKVSEHYTPGPWAGFGSVQTWTGLRQSQRSGFPWWYGDHGYFRRNKFYRVTLNGYQHTGLGKADYNRLRALEVDMQPWRNDGRHVLVCPPDAAWADLMNFDAGAWKWFVLKRLADFTDRPVRVRERGTKQPLAADLVGCCCLVTHASNAAVEALVFGVPVICTGDCAARAMGRADPSLVEYPLRMDRAPWAATLAANQWTMNEIAAGACWKELQV